MLTEITELIGLDVYTNKGYYLGKIEDVSLDIDNQTAYGLYIPKPNPLLVEDGVSILVPYRGGKAVGTIVILKKFPDYVSLSTSKSEKTEEKKA